MALAPGVYAVGIVAAGRVAGLAAAVQAEHRLVAAEVDDQAHGGDQPGVEVLSPGIGRDVEGAVVAAGRVGAAVQVAGQGIDAGALARRQVGGQFAAVAAPVVAVQLAPLPLLAVAAQAGFQQFRMGYASALAWILFAIILALTLVVFRWSDAWVYYEGSRR